MPSDTTLRPDSIQNPKNSRIQICTKLVWGCVFIFIGLFRSAGLFLDFAFRAFLCFSSARKYVPSREAHRGTIRVLANRRRADRTWLVRMLVDPRMIRGHVVGDPSVRTLLRDREDRMQQPDMGERLGEVAQQTPAAGVVFFAEQPNVILKRS